MSYLAGVVTRMPDIVDAVMYMSDLAYMPPYVAIHVCMEKCMG